jgi:hypothetical protein
MSSTDLGQRHLFTVYNVYFEKLESRKRKKGPYLEGDYKDL